MNSPAQLKKLLEKSTRLGAYDLSRPTEVVSDNSLSAGEFNDFKSFNQGPFGQWMEWGQWQQNSVDFD